MRRGRVAVGLVVIGASVAAGCGSGSTPSTAPPPTQPAATSTTSAGPTPSVDSTDSAVQGTEYVVPFETGDGDEFEVRIGITGSIELTDPDAQVDMKCQKRDLPAAGTTYYAVALSVEALFEGRPTDGPGAIFQYEDVATYNISFGSPDSDNFFFLSSIDQQSNQCLPSDLSSLGPVGSAMSSIPDGVYEAGEVRHASGILVVPPPVSDTPVFVNISMPGFDALRADIPVSLEDPPEGEVTVDPAYEGQ